MNAALLGVMGGGFVIAMLAGATTDVALNEDTSIDTQGNIDAMLALILEGESSHNYRAIVGGGSFGSYATHPGLRVDDSPEPGFLPGKASHAAGGYQFQPGTWLECKRALSLHDFSPASQDAAAIYLMKRRGAYEAAANGQAAIAADLLKNEWEMFQTWTVSRVEKAFNEYGGTLA